MKNNTLAVRGKLNRRDIIFVESKTGWREMIELIEQHEERTNNTSNPKFFCPSIEYHNFCVMRMI